ncbi:DoxX-like family protein [Chungangia koreensis]|uniref:DoxX-like family protein n=1 Tax=Chungangia koreensis TaxID=752657 RepID=A0ABV8X600_9LACT
MKRKPIYVEIPVEEDMDRLWKATQEPELHTQWDLRFTSITYLPREEGEPQLFSYKTNIGIMTIEGWGKSAGEHNAKDGSRTSSLHFGTDQKVSIIREGKGYWKYKQEGHGITFLTQYDYEVNFGKIGAFIDRLFFRPMIGWATALSFDVLRRWLEMGETPASQYIRFFFSWLIVFLFSFVWLYHGIVPKIVLSHPEEIEAVTGLLGLSGQVAANALLLAGILEGLFGLTWLIYRKKEHLFALQMILFPLLTLSILFGDPSDFAHPYNPLTFNAALFVLSIIGYVICKDIPTAKSCKRKK